MCHGVLQSIDVLLKHGYTTNDHDAPHMFLLYHMCSWWAIVSPNEPHMLWSPLRFSRLFKVALILKMLKMYFLMATLMVDEPWWSWWAILVSWWATMNHDAPSCVFLMLMQCKSSMNVLEVLACPTVIGWHLHGPMGQLAWPIRVLGLIPSL